MLGEFALHQEGPTWTSTFVTALGTLDVDEKTARQTVARSAARGLLEAEKVGRRTRWHLTPRAVKLLTEGSKRIYTFRTQQLEWNSEWVVLVVAIPEARREARYSLKVQLGWAGFAPLSAGVWICPWAERESEAQKVLTDLNLESVAHLFVGNLTNNEDPVTLAAQTWNLPEVEKVYDEFQEAHANDSPENEESAFVALTKLINDWRRIPLIDPDLPSELLPEDWVGNRAAHLFHNLHNRWRDQSAIWWKAQNARD